MSIQKDIKDLMQAEIINHETADKIRAFYQLKENKSSNRLFIVFGILGATLVGLGIILIIAHNWDHLSKITKTILAIAPLFTGQLFCAYVLLKRKGNIAWVEGTSAFLFFAVGASISMISQIYHIEGNLASFLLTWMLLCIPLVYLMKSSFASLLYIIGITYYVCEAIYWTYRPHEPAFIYWGLLSLVLPYYIHRIKHHINSNFTTFLHWLVPISVTIALGSIYSGYEELIFILYVSFFGLLYSIGHLSAFKNSKLRNNSYLILGSTGTISILMALSYEWFWKEIIGTAYPIKQLLFSNEFMVIVIVSLLAILALVVQRKNKPIKEVKPIEFVFIIFIITFIVGLYSNISVLIINLLIFAIGILTVKEGAKKNHLGILNYGLLIIAALVVNRFFDTNISFVLKGILFICVGIGFFIANSRMLKKRKKNG